MSVNPAWNWVGSLAHRWVEEGWWAACEHPLSGAPSGEWQLWGLSERGEPRGPIGGEQGPPTCPVVLAPLLEESGLCVCVLELPPLQPR